MGASGRTTAVTVAIALLLAACRGGGDKPLPGAAGSTSSVTTATGSAGTVVVHPLKSLGPIHTAFVSTAPLPRDQPVPGGTTATSGGMVRKAQSFPGIPTVGPLFLVLGDTATLHICTAVVVHSISGDVIMTAAHCVHGGLLPGYHAGLAFVPGFHDGQAPYGVWTTTSVILDSRWIDSEDPDADVAFLTVARTDGKPGTLEQLTGADTLATAPSFTGQADIVAYPIGAEQPISCAGPTSRQSDTQLRFACSGFSNGSSGGPFVTGMDPHTGAGAVIGVLGGYQQGGSTSDVSYSAYPTAAIQTLYRTAAETR